MARPRFTSFVMFAGMRTGSNFLEASLNGFPGVRCEGELFNPHFIGKKGQVELDGVTLAARETDPEGFLRARRRAAPGLHGFRLFHDHDPRIAGTVLADPHCGKIILTRNPIESYVSLKIARATDQWKLTDPARRKTATTRFVAAEFRAHLQEIREYHATLRRRLQETGQAAFVIDYDDIGDTEVLNGLAAFLGVEGKIDAPDRTLKKQNPEPLVEKVENAAEMAAELGRLDWFNLARTAMFEPERGPAIPSALAAGGLVYLPVKAGPEDRVTAWLGALGPIEGGFTQTSLRQWKRAHPRHRSFTVISDPLRRAERAFALRVLSGARADVRQALSGKGMPVLPPAGEGFADPAGHRAAFLHFLRWLKRNLAGQTGQRVDPHWATQSAVLDGFARFQTPDAVLREDRLASGLTYLAAEVGVTPPPLPDAPPASAYADDDEVTAAVRDAYARDYAAFGFGGHAA